MFKLVISDDEGKTTVVPLVREEITIGRKEGNTIRLTERNVSRRHARIAKRAADYVLEDLASYNGIVVNGARLSDARPVRNGDQILIGDYKLQIVEEAGVQPAVPPSTPSPPSEPIVPLLAAPSNPAPATNGQGAPGALPVAPGLAALNDPFAPPAASAVPDHIKGLRLVFLAPAGVPAPVMLDRLPLVMGRSEAADIALPFSSISREHAKIFLENNELMIEDMGSSNGVQVNGEKSTRAELGPGDMVQLGVVEFRVARRGDSTVVIQRQAADLKEVATRKSSLPLVGAVLGAGAMLGIVAFFVVHHGNVPPAATAPVVMPLVPTPVEPVQPTPVAPTVAAPTPPSVAVPAVVAPPTPVAPTVAAPTPPPPAVVAPPAPVAPPTPVAPVAPVAPAVVSPPVNQTIAVPDRTHRTHTTAAAPEHTATTGAHTPTVAAPTVAAPTPTAPPEHTSSGGGSGGMDCARNAGGDNAAIVHCLTGHAGSEEALAMLIAAQRGSGDRAGAMRNMHTYQTRFPSGAHFNDFQRFLENNE